MIKTKIIQLNVMSIAFGLIFIFGAIYASGNKGDILANKSLTTEGKLGAGLISIGILIWLWTFTIAIQPLFKWKNKSKLLNAIIYSALIFFPISLLVGIYYLLQKKVSEEKVKILKKEESNG